MSNTAGPIIYKVVLDTLNKKTESDSAKTFAEAMIDGSITKQDLILINSTSTFPTTNYSRSKLPEGEYSSQDAMASFVEIIGPYLSDYNLYKITKLLTEIEMLNGLTVYRNSSLAKSFIFYETQRQSAQMSAGNTALPQTFITHMREHVLPLCSELYKAKAEENFTTILSFSLKFADAAEKHSKEIINANTSTFSADALNKTAPKSSADFAAEMKNLQKNYRKLAVNPILRKSADLIENVSDRIKEVGKKIKSSKETKTETDLKTDNSTKKQSKKTLEKYLIKSDLALNSFNNIGKLDKIPVERIVLILKAHRKDGNFIQKINKENLYMKALMEKDLAKFILTSKQYAKIMTPDQTIILLQAHADDKDFMKAAFPRFNIAGRINLEQLALSDIKIFEKIISSAPLLSKLGHKVTLEIAQHYNKDSTLINTIEMLFKAIKDNSNNAIIKNIQDNVIEKLNAVVDTAKENTETADKKIVIGAETVTAKTALADATHKNERTIATDAPGLRMLPVTPH